MIPPLLPTLAHLLVAGVSPAPVDPGTLSPEQDSILEQVELAAFLVADSLEVGPEYSIELAVGLPEGSDAKGAGIPGLIVQLDVPESVELTGRRVESLQDLKRNEFLEEPYERLLEEDGASLTFKLTRVPAEGSSIGINVVGYLSHGEGASFLRRRLEVKLEPNATGTEGDARNSSWGRGDERLHIGDRAPAFLLPQLGTEGDFDMVQVVGKRKLVLTTYRAQW